MGQLEIKNKKRRKKQNIQRALLATIAAAGFITLAAMAPNALGLLKYMPIDRTRFNYRIRTAAGRLVAKKQAQWIKRDKSYYLQLTEKGKKALAFEQARMSLEKPKRKWDGQWRMVVFDVPERRRNIRNRLCALMREVGFVRLQESVWVYPHDCEDFMALLKAELRIGKDVLYVIADRIEHDVQLRKRFDLSAD